MCCNGSNNTAPQLDAVAFTWLSCVELPLHRMLMRIATEQSLTLFGGLEVIQLMPMPIFLPQIKCILQFTMLMLTGSN